MLASRAILKRLRGANVQLLMDLEPLEDGWHGAQAQTAASGVSTVHWRWVRGHSTPIALAAGAAV
jgi:hypothetical protein